MSGFGRPNSNHPRWRAALRAGALAAGVAVLVGAPLAARAEEEHGHWRGHEWREHHEWREPYRPYGYYGEVGPPTYYAPSYGYYAPGYGVYAPSYGYGYEYPGPTFSLNFRGPG